MTDLQLFNDGERISTAMLAEVLEYDHTSMLSLMCAHIGLFVQFGSIQHVLTKTGGRPRREFLLNEWQVLLLVMLRRQSSDTAQIKASVLSAVREHADVLAAVKRAMEDFDFDGIQDRYVYAAQDAQGRIKIGISRDPQRRVKELNIGNADELRLVFTKKAGGVRYESETELHHAAAAYHIRSEWFTADAGALLDNEVAQ